jgi:hypothetical protein
MSIFSLSVRTTNITIANACLEIRTGSADRPRVMEIDVAIAAATASVFGLGRPAAIGITPTAPVTLLGEDPIDTFSTVQLALAWATGPTSPTGFYRRIPLSATIGAGIIWTFPRGLIISPSSSLVILNITANSVDDITLIIIPQGLTDLLKSPYRLDWKDLPWPLLWRASCLLTGDPSAQNWLNSCPFSNEFFWNGTCTYKVITGVTRDNTGAPLGGVTVDAFDTLTDTKKATTISDAFGNYIIYVPTVSPHYLVGYLAGSPDLAGTTQNILVGV